MRNLQVLTDLEHDITDNFGFQENFELLQYSGYHTTSMSIYTDYGNLSKYYDLEQDCIIEDNKRNRVLIKRYLVKSGYYSHSDLFGNLDELVTDIGSVDYSNIEELYEVLDTIGIPYTSNYARTSTRGYSQGDYADILVNVAEFAQVMGAEFEMEGMQKWFDHYFWDSPIFGTIEISFDQTENCVNFEYEDTFDFIEFTNDEYDVNGLEVEAIMKSIKGDVKVPLSVEEIKLIEDKLNGITYQDVTYPRCGC